MSTDRLPRYLICATLIAFAPSLVAGESASPAASTQAYQVLRELGLLQGAPVADAAASSTAESASSSSQSSPPPAPGAREVLQQLGLLDAPESPPADTAPPEQPIADAPVPEPGKSPEAPAAHDLGLVNAPASAPAPDSPALSAADPALVLAAADPLPANAPAPLLGSPAADVLQPVAAPLSGPLSRAYELLRAKGLLPGGPALVVKTSAASPRRELNTDRVLVDKSDRMLTLFRNGQPIREYRISLGTIPSGAKKRAGDQRTPEGVYTLDWRNPNSRFYKSIHISYPNDLDRQRARQAGVDPGGNIMIHGEHYLPSLQRTLRRARSQKDWTAGCIALKNEQMDELWREIADGTPIEIRP